MSKFTAAVIVMLVSVFISAVSQILLKKAANRRYSSWIREYLNLRVIAAYGMFFVSTILTMLALKYVPLSMQPILESTSYIYISVMGYFLLKERFSRKKILGLGLILLGKVMGFTERIRPDMFAEHFIAMTAVGAVILSIQHVLSLISDNQILPLIVGIAGGFLGLFSMFFPAAVNRLVLWGYFGIFSVAGVDWQRTTDEAIYLYYQPLPAVSFIGFLIAGAVIYLIGKWFFLRKEV